MLQEIQRRLTCICWNRNSFSCFRWKLSILIGISNKTAISRFLKGKIYASIRFKIKTDRFYKLLKLFKITQVSYHIIFNLKTRVDFDNLIIIVPNVIRYCFKDSFFIFQFYSLCFPMFLWANNCCSGNFSCFQIECFVEHFTAWFSMTSGWCKDCILR